MSSVSRVCCWRAADAAPPSLTAQGRRQAGRQYGQRPIQPPAGHTKTATRGEIEALKSTTSKFLLPLAILAAGFALLAVAIALVFRLVVGRRLSTMRRHFERIAARPGHSILKGVALEGGDEVAALAGSFNTMVDKVRHAHASLETRVTERTQELAAANEELRDREHQLHTLFDQMLNGFAVHEILCDPAGRPCDYRFLQVNRAFTELTGLAADQTVGKRVREVLPDIEPEWIERYGRVALTGEPDRFEMASTSLGRRYDVAVYQAGPGRFAVVFSDVTGRKRAEEELKEREVFLRTLLDNVHVGVMVVDPETHIIEEVSPAAATMLGAAAHEIVGKVCHQHLCPDKQGACPITDLGQEADNSERVFQRADGSRLPVLKTVSRVHIAGRERLLESFVDLS